MKTCPHCCNNFENKNPSVKYCSHKCRFFSKINIGANPDKCWTWTCGTYPDGYGRFKVNKKYYRSTRYMMKLLGFKIPKNHVVMHECDNPICINPLHLSIGTVQDNVLDAFKKKRRKPPIPLKGEQNKSSKLNKNQVSLIRKIYKENKSSHRKLAKIFGVSSSVICKIINKKIWKDI